MGRSGRLWSRSRASSSRFWRETQRQCKRFQTPRNQGFGEAGKKEITALEGQWTDSQSEPQLERSLARLHGITRPCEEEVEDNGEKPALPRLILGCSEVLLHPRKVKTPEDIKIKHPKLAIFRSVLSGNLLACGELGGERQ